jgi:hypothetical protein
MDFLGTGAESFGNRRRDPELMLHSFTRGDATMTIGTILLIILILVLVGALPTWGYSRGWGYGPSGIVGVIVVILLILLLLGRI